MYSLQKDMAPFSYEGMWYENSFGESVSSGSGEYDILWMTCKMINVIEMELQDDFLQGLDEDFQENLKEARKGRLPEKLC